MNHAISSSVGKTMVSKPIEEEIPLDLLEALGRIAVAGPMVELSLIVGINMLTSKGDLLQTYHLVGGEDFKVIHKKFQNIVRSKDPNRVLTKEFDDLNKRLVRTSKERNYYIHSIWYSEDNKIYGWKFNRDSNGKGKLLKRKEIKLAELRKTGDEAEQLRDEIIEFCNKVNAQIGVFKATKIKG